jgi:hypothetical protein
MIRRRTVVEMIRTSWIKAQTNGDGEAGGGK